MLYTRYCYGGGFRGRNVARMEKLEDLVQHLSVQLKEGCTWKTKVLIVFVKLFIAFKNASTAEAVWRRYVV